MADEEKRKEEEARRAAGKVETEGNVTRRKLSTGGGGLLSGDDGGSIPTSVASSRNASDAEDGTSKAVKRVRSPEKKESLKKSKMEEEVEGVEEEKLVYGDDTFENMGVLLKKMRRWWAQPTIMKMVTKPQTRKFAAYLDQFQNGIEDLLSFKAMAITKVVEKNDIAGLVRTTIREEVAKLNEERARSEVRMEERKELADIVCASVREEVAKLKVNEESQAVGSYAAVLRQEGPKVPRVSGMKGPVGQAPKQVMVRHDTKEADEVTTILKRLVKPSEIGLKVRRLVPMRNGVMVEAETEEGVENLTRQEALKKAGLKVERPEKKKPFIMVYDVSANLKDEEIKDEVFSRNITDSQIEEDHFRQEFQVKHRYKDVRSGGKRCHIVVECSVRVRNWLRSKERVFIEWQSCRVKDYVDVARCFMCQRFGHVKKHCKAEKPCCSHCAGEHEYEKCPDKDNKEKESCANCRRDKRENCRHGSGSRNCPAFERAVKRYNERIDYGV